MSGFVISPSHSAHQRWSESLQLLSTQREGSRPPLLTSLWLEIHNVSFHFNLVLCCLFPSACCFSAKSGAELEPLDLAVYG